MTLKEKGLLVTIATPIIATGLLLLFVLSKSVCSTIPASEVRTISKIVGCNGEVCECEVRFTTQPSSLRLGKKFQAKAPSGSFLSAGSFVFTAGDQIDRLLNKGGKNENCNN